MEIMDYEKKYKVNEEAVKKIAERVYDNGSTVINRNDLEEMFPELKKESEDERIRKAIKLMYSFLPNKPKYIGDVSVEDMFAWLEKKSSEPNWCHHKVDLSNCSEEYRKAYYDGWNNCNQQHAQLEAEQKPTEVRTTGYWHVEDVEQKSWSEEDDNMLQSILDEYKSMPTEKRNWLKSLKDKYAWKPSNEQIIALQWVLNNVPYNKHKEEISGLLEQLNNLEL